jgi:hypothetical protein
VDAAQEAAGLAFQLAAFDLRVQRVMKVGGDGQRALEAEGGAVDEALEGLRRLTAAVPAPKRLRFPLQLPVEVRVITDERGREDRTDVAEGVVRIHPFRFRLTPAQEGIQLVGGPAHLDDVRQPYVALEIGFRHFEILRAQIQTDAAPHLALLRALRTTSSLPICRGKNAPDHVFDFVGSHKNPFFENGGRTNFARPPG